MSSKKNWCIVVPYRDRVTHLAVFIPYYNSLFPGVPIYVVEQADDKPFNRAKLFNVGYLEAAKNFDYASYSDVDMFVDPSKIDSYSFPENPTCLATECSQFNYTMPYGTYFGGVCLLSSAHMDLSNGFSNLFKNHGGEDDEMFKNLTAVGLNPEWRKTRFECFEHPRNRNHQYYNENLRLLNAGRSLGDGLSSCEYDIVSVVKKAGFTRLSVHL